MTNKGENYVADIDRRLPGFWREDRLLSFFLAFLVLMTIFVPMVGLSRPGRIAIDLTFALMLLSGAIATIYKRMLMYLIIALTILEFTADLIVEFNPSFSPRGWDTALKVFCMAILVVMTLKQTFLSGPVTVHRVMGGIAAYLLIGVTWAFGYKLLMEMIPDAIHFQTPLGAAVPTGEPSRLIYFSFETLTTVAFGDAYPVHRIARSLTTAEALIGQLYPAILIATLVGMALQARFSAALKETEVKKPS
jgi:Ion channel